MVQSIKLLKELSLAFGPPSCESNVRDIIADTIIGYDDIITDKLGNYIVVRKGNGKTNKKLLISAHMDEVGFMITHIDDDGYLHFDLLGGIDPRVLCGRHVLVGDENSRIKGVIMSKAIHLQSGSERNEATPISSMYIDIGANNREEAEKLIQIGMFGTFESEFVQYGQDDKFIKGKAIDDRLGCVEICDLFKRLHDENIILDYDLYGAFTVREEIGFSGAGAVSYSVEPDKAIILEATAVADIADVDESLKVGKLGKGGVISIADNGTIYDREFIDFALKTAETNNIKCQIKRYVSGGNDAGVIQRSNSGVKVLAISAPCRYLHTASNVINIDDYTAINELLYNIAIKINFN